eukprot:gnl/TRDRNA2_/TRDRNA2_177676_c0_seq3.p1 gnl/TRDRNA2_/TRDRNA2_177676_c0~~gnl/TRDRNA2_/TRDRNA2_177676_c0_seq3.p1  ORF type:complete len:1170 (-),score=240.73 gnl/TRDRNA2_/TRDRNA2_177676_c0_seq3:112-3297(-)
MVEVIPLFLLENASKWSLGSHVYYNAFKDTPCFDSIKLFDHIDASKTKGAVVEYWGVYGKLHCVNITDTYENAPVPLIKIDEKLAHAANFQAGSMVHVVNNATGARWVLPLLYTDRRGAVEVHGIKNHCTTRSENMYVDDTIIVMAYCTLPWSPEIAQPAGVLPTVIVPDKAMEKKRSNIPSKSVLSTGKEDLKATDSPMDKVARKQTSDRERYNQNCSKLLLQEATVNNADNGAFENIDLCEVDLSQTKLEFAKTCFSIMNLCDSQLMQQGANQLLQKIFNRSLDDENSANVSYVAIPEAVEGDTQSDSPFLSIGNMEMLNYVVNRTTGQGFSVICYRTKLVKQLTICGPICKAFKPSDDLVVMATCISSYERTAISTMLIAVDISLNDFLLGERGGVFGELFLSTSLDTDDNGYISTFVVPKHIPIAAKDFSPMLANCNAPFGVWVTDAFLEKHGLQYGDFVCAWDGDGTYNWDCLRRSEHPELCYVMGYSCSETSFMDLQVVGLRSDPNPFITLSSYWKMITPAMWDLPALAKDLVALIAAKFPQKKLEDIRILHASCGAGDLCYEMMKLGANLDMSDASQSMLRLNEKVGRLRYPEQAARVAPAGNNRRFCAKWGQLKDTCGLDAYDVILIRGNSTPYVNGTWDRYKDEHDECATIQEMVKSLSSVHSVLAAGGMLYLDKCHEETSMVKTYHYDNIEDFPVQYPERLKNLRVLSLHWEFTTSMEKYTRTWSIQSKMKDQSELFKREVTGFWLTEKVLMGMARHLGFESCKRHQLPSETVYKGYVLQKSSDNKQEYYDRVLQRYLDVWLSDDVRSSAINWGLYEEATSWSAAQSERYKTMLKAFEPITSSGKPFRVLDVGCGTGYTLDRLLHDFPTTMTGLGIDPSGAEIDFAVEQFQNDNIKFEKLFSNEIANDPKYHGTFDIVMSESAIAHVPPSARKLFPEECFKLLKPGGLLWFNDPMAGPHRMNTETEVFVMQRLQFAGLWGLEEWKHLISKAGFVAVKGTDNSFSQERSYRHLSKVALEKGYPELSEDYTISADNIRSGRFAWGWLEAFKPK